MVVSIAPKRSIRDLIDERGLRHGWVAARIGVSPAMLTNVMRGRRRLRVDAAQRLAELLGVPLDEMDIRTHTRGLDHGG
jgi:antitoxin component HigA of HigAB toxin-antitoxin module